MWLFVTVDATWIGDYNINKPKLQLSGDADWKTTHEYCPEV